MALAFALFPVLWVVSAAFSDGNLSRQQLIPENPTLDNFRELMTVPNHPPFWSWFRNSLVVGIVTAVVSVFLCASPPTRSHGCASRAAVPGCSPCC